MSDKYASYGSDFLSYTIDREQGKIAFFGIESGGRDRDKHASYNLMLPAYGGVFGAFKKSLPVSSKITDNLAFFENAQGSSISYNMTDLRTLNIELNKINSNDIFSTRLSIKTAPPTIWTTGEPKKLKTTNPLTIFKTKYSLPLIIHFPDFGRLEISATSDDVYCIEELQLSRDFVGLDLGYLNYGYDHNTMHALHYGSSFLTFKSKKPIDKVELTLKVLEECYPKFPEENNEKYNGLKRTWLNSFALNRALFDMGDNIYLGGTAHLAMHMKSDLLQIMGAENEQFKVIRRTFEKQIERTFKDIQSENGEVKGYGVETTASAIISLTGIANWNLPLAKKLLPYSIKAADFILSMDTDGDGIFEVPFPGDYMDQPSEYGHQCNWWDNFAFGHKDIYFNYLCHRALRELCELLDRLKMHTLADKYKVQLSKFDSVFFETFYNSETGLMAGWISRNGSVHDYGFTFAVSMGINEGLVPLDIGKKMMKSLLDKMKEEGYGDLRYGIPGNVIPVNDSDKIDWACMSDWGQYENGGLSGMNGFHFLTAMYNVGLEREADEILFAILNTYEKCFTHSGLMPGYCQSVDWRTKNGVPCGYNYLADNYYFLLSVYVGKFKMEHPATKPIKDKI